MTDATPRSGRPKQTPADDKTMTTRETRLLQTIACEKTRAARDADAREIERRTRWPHPLDTATFTCQCLILIIVIAFIFAI